MNAVMGRVSANRTSAFRRFARHAYTNPCPSSGRNEGASMEFTGERVVLDYDGISDAVLARAAARGASEAELRSAMQRLIANHLARYYFAEGLVAGRDGPLAILDAACGSGYGSYILMGRDPAVTRSVVGVDIDAATIAYAAAQFTCPGLEYRQADCRDLPWSAATFDLIVSFETLEHLDRADGARFVERLAALLRPGGIVVLSTPVPVTDHSVRPNNPFHSHEYTNIELEALLAPHFAHRVLYEQGFTAGCAILPVTSAGTDQTPASPRDRLNRQTPMTPAPLFFAPDPDVPPPPGSRFHLAICSASPLPATITPVVFSFRAVHTARRP